MTIAQIMAASLALQPAGPAGIPGATNTGYYASRDAAAAATVDPAISMIGVGGKAALGDGGWGLWISVNAEPAHTMKFSSNAGTRWWEPLGKTVRPQMYNVFAAGVNSISALDACISFCSNKGGGRVTIDDRLYISSQWVIASDYTTIEWIGAGAIEAIGSTTMYPLVYVLGDMSALSKTTVGAITKDVTRTLGFTDMTGGFLNTHLIRIAYTDTNNVIRSHVSPIAVVGVNLTLRDPFPQAIPSGAAITVYYGVPRKGVHLISPRVSRGAATGFSLAGVGFQLVDGCTLRGGLFADNFPTAAFFANGFYNCDFNLGGGRMLQNGYYASPAIFNGAASIETFGGSRSKLLGLNPRQNNYFGINLDGLHHNCEIDVAPNECIGRAVKFSDTSGCKIRVCVPYTQGIGLWLNGLVQDNDIEVYITNTNDYADPISSTTFLGWPIATNGLDNSDNRFKGYVKSASASSSLDFSNGLGDKRNTYQVHLGNGTYSFNSELEYILETTRTKTNFRASKFSNQAGVDLPANVYTKVWFDTEAYDRNSDYIPGATTGADSRFTAKIKGRYRFKTSLRLTSGSSSVSAFKLRKNGTTDLDYKQFSGTRTTEDISLETFLDIDVNDYVEVYYSPALGAVGQTIFGGSYTFFEGTLIEER